MRFFSEKGGLMIQFARLTFASMLSLGALALSGTSASAAFIPVYSTGVTDSGALAAPGGADSHYSITSAPTGASTPVVGSSLPSVWTPNTSSSQWIGVQANLNTHNPTGSYDYRTTFSLAGLNAATASIMGSIAADDYVTVLINGAATSYVNYGGFQAFTPFSITSGFVAGSNTIDFIVTNAPNVSPDGTPAGLQVNITSATANAIVPEPASIVLVSLGSIAAAGFGVRRRRAAV